MSRNGSRRCRACGRKFRPRNSVHVYCSLKSCRDERRAGYMKEYMQGWKRKHPAYWKSEAQRDYMKEWREAHPDYFRKWRARQKRKRRGR